MRTHLKPVAGIVLWAALAIAQGPRAAEPNVIRAIDVAEKDGGVELEIRGSRTPSYTVFKLQDPPRLVVDLAGADVSAVASPVPVGRGGVREAREGAVGYEVAPRGDALLVKVKGEAGGTQAAARPAAPRHAPPAAEP